MDINTNTVMRAAAEGQEQIKGFAEANVKYGVDTTSIAIIQWGLVFFIVFFVAVIIYILTIGKDKFVKGIKKELDIDDLQKEVITLKNEFIKLNENIGSLVVVLETTKKFSPKEMYNKIKERFELSITQLKDDFIEVVEENSLYENESVIIPEILDKIKERVYFGREEIYDLNFDENVINDVFNRTDKSVKLASKALEDCFREFYDKGEENITINDYKLLKRKIKGIAKDMKLKSDKMLREVILRVNN